MNKIIDDDGNWICPICKELFDKNSDWMATNYNQHMFKHSKTWNINIYDE